MKKFPANLQYAGCCDICMLSQAGACTYLCWRKRSMDADQRAKLAAAIEVMIAQVEDQLREVADTKIAINQLRKRLGEQPLFDDVEPEKIRTGKTAIRRDQNYGQPLATA